MTIYKAYPKRAVAEMIPGTLSGKSLFELWETGAKELEKTAPGKLLTAPIRLPAAVVTSTEKTVEQVPKTLKTVSYTLPIIAIGAAIAGTAYLVYRFKKEKKETTNPPPVTVPGAVSL